MLHGFDISGFQGTTAPTADFVFVKATEGSSYTNAEFAAQWQSAKSRAKIRGAYHFARPEQSSGASQADRLLSVAKAVRGEVLILDLEASKLTQAATNTWARNFGDRLRNKAPGVTTLAYFGAGYASNGTGRNLKDHFDYWWYPQYPSAYQVMGLVDGPQSRLLEEEWRAANRSHATPDRTPIDTVTHSWPPSLAPWLPGGLTCGWSKPDLWQFTDNFGGLDASISPLTLSQLAGGGPTPTPTEEPDMAQRDLKDGLDKKTGLILIPKTGGYSYVEAFADNTYTDGGQVKAFDPVTIRVAIRKANGTWQSDKTFVVGRGPKDTSQPQQRVKIDDKNSTAVSVTRVTGTGDEPITITAY